MYDLFIIECLITLFSALAITQPFVQPFRKITGLVVLPILALLLSITSLPAFGFRPELLPLAFFTLVATIGSIPRLSDMARKLRTDDYDGRSVVFAIIKLVILLCVALFAFIFLPKVEPIGWISETARHDDKQSIIMKASDLTDESRNIKLKVRYYYPNGIESAGSALLTVRSPVPIIIVSCPTLGGLPFYEEYCTALASRGFVVAAITRRTELNIGTFFGVYRDLITSCLLSGRTAEADTFARAEEQNLLSDIGFFIRFLKSADGKNVTENIGIDISRISIAGFGSGGAAALIYGAQGSEYGKTAQEHFRPSGENLELIASISLEGPPATFREAVIQAEESKSLGAEKTQVGRKALYKIKLFFQGIMRKSGFEGYRFVGIVPEARIPSLMVVSDRIGDTDARDGRYAVLLRFLLGAKAMSAIVSFDGAGILEFTDAPRKYPLLSTFTSGLKPRTKPSNTSYAIKAADASVAFILLAIERKQSLKADQDYYEKEPGVYTNIPAWPEFTSTKGVYIEMGGEW